MNFASPVGGDYGQPNSTLYIQNLNEKVSLKHLKTQLREKFEVFGEVVDVVAKSRLALKGQAFILFRDVESARRAMEQMQGERLYGKSIVLKYAKYKSDFISKADGTYEIEKRRREMDRVEKSRQPRITRRQMLAQIAANPSLQGLMGMPGAPGFPGAMPGGAPMLGPQMVSGELQLPNKLLFLQNLPEGTQESELSSLFKRFPGFIEIRLVPNRPDVAFAEYENEAQAAQARNSLDNHEIQLENRIRVTFARR